MVKINVNSIIIETERQIESLLDQDIISLSPWISVKDKLPPLRLEVLYFASINNGMSREIMTGHLDENGWTHCCLFYSTKYVSEIVSITHWMELPSYPNNEKCNHANIDHRTHHKCEDCKIFIPYDLE